MRLWFRFVLVAVILVSAGLFLRAHSQPELLPPRENLSAFPQQVGGWVGRDAELPPKILETLGPGEFLSRNYRRKLGEPYIDFFAAYFPSQRTGNTIHSPQNCLPGTGWTPLESVRVPVSTPQGGQVLVNRYILAKGADRIIVLYWYQSHGRGIASEYWAKFYLVADAIRMNRTDGALVRIVTPLARGEDTSAGEARAVEFLRQILPELGTYIPD